MYVDIFKGPEMALNKLLACGTVTVAKVAKARLSLPKIG